MAFVDGALHLRWARTAAPPTVRVPLVRTSRGDFHAAPARVEDGSGAAWALTAATTVRID